MNYEDDEIDIGYMPSIGVSRKSGMKKIARKNDNATGPKKQPTRNQKQSDDFALLDELLGQDLSTKKAKPAVKRNYGNDSIDSFFDEPSNIDSKDHSASKPSRVNITTHSVQKEATVIVDNPIIEEVTKTDSMFKLKRPGTAVNTTKNSLEKEEPMISMSPSIRVMKPPLRRKNSRDSIRQQKPNSQAEKGTGFNSLTNQINLPEELPVTGMSNRMMKPPLRRKQSSTQLSIRDEPEKKYLDIPNIRTDHQQKSSLTIQDSIVVGGKTPLQFNSNRDTNQWQASNRQESNRVPLTLTDEPTQKRHQQTAAAVNISRPPILSKSKQQFDNLQASIPQTLSNQEVQKQVQFVKKTYQSHIATLRQNLEQQIRSNSETRQRLMKQASAMVDSQKVRLHKIHKQELERVKQMNEWQIKRMQQNYQSQIVSLQNQLKHQSSLLDNATMTNKVQNKHSSLETDKRQIKYLQEKLRAERRILEDREKLLNTRQLNLDQRERQFNKRKRLDQEKVRDEQKRIFQSEIETKKQIINQRRDLEQDKQKMATEMAQLELGAYKKNQNIHQKLAELESQKKEFQREKQNFREMNRKLIAQAKLKEDNLKAEKEKLSRIEADLIHKIKVVEAKAAKDNSQYRSATSLNKKQNTWIDPVENLKLQKTYHNKTADLNKRVQTTQHRFNNISQNIKQNLSHGHSANFDINKYIMSMAKYTRTRQQYQ